MTESVTLGRIHCVVIGCRRTAAAEKYPPDTIIICGKCFRLASKRLRRRIRRLERIGRKLGVNWNQVTLGSTRPGSPQRRVLVIRDRVWHQLVKSATNTKVGIG